MLFLLAGGKPRTLDGGDGEGGHELAGDDIVVTENECVLLPLPFPAENHDYTGSGVEDGGCGIAGD